jgi:hypothetical protein
VTHVFDQPFIRQQDMFEGTFMPEKPNVGFPPETEYERLRIVGLEFGMPPTARAIVEIDALRRKVAELTETVNSLRGGAGKPG